MGWSGTEETKNGMDVSSKIIIAIIACLVLIIILILLMLFAQSSSYTLKVNNTTVENYDIDKLVVKFDNLTYIDIEEFSKLVEYEYHKGEFKAYTNEENKCYVQGKEETTSFFLNDNKIYKLPVNEFDSDYGEVSIKNPVIEKNGKMYATIETIRLAFNVVVTEKDKELEIYTLSELIKLYDVEVKKWGYTGIADLNFENQKAVLNNCLIVKKKDGLYKIINTSNTTEIVPDRYKSIQFSEISKEFFVTNSLDQVGIINLDGTTNIEPVYDSILALDKKMNLYLVQKDEKYGVIKSGNTTIISPEYDKIGLNDNDSAFILDTLIPVCKNNKWGAFNKNGKLVFEIKYDKIGCDVTTVEIDGLKKNVKSVISIQRCNGVVVKKDDKYGLLDLDGNELVPIAVSSIYEIEETDNEELKYFMLYNGKELNVIERLIAAGLLEDTSDNKVEENTNTTTNIISNNVVITNNTIEGNSSATTQLN